MQQEDREQRALPGSAERERAIVVADLQRAEKPEIHALGCDRTTGPDSAEITDATGVGHRRRCAA